MDKQLEQLIRERDVLVAMNFGSTLYGLNTPESDLDIKGIYLPTAKEILLQKVPKSINITPKELGVGVKNGANDVDLELYSLQRFIELCLKGETVSMDMLHCNEENILYCSNHALWDYIQGERASFYSKNLSVLSGYVSRQADKYGQKGGRINTVSGVIKILTKINTIQGS
jgi:predicted nucleotidyltransferase